MKIGYDAKRAFRNNSGLGNYSRMVIGGVWNEVLRIKHPEGKLSTLKNKDIVVKNEESTDAVVLYTPSVKGRHEHYFEEVGGMRSEVGGIEIRVPKGVWRVMPDVWRSVWMGVMAK